VAEVSRSRVGHVFNVTMISYTMANNFVRTLNEVINFVMMFGY
jgi:hypothetical protein